MQAADLNAQLQSVLRVGHENSSASSAASSRSRVAGKKSGAQANLHPQPPQPSRARLKVIVHPRIRSAPTEV